MTTIFGIHFCFSCGNIGAKDENGFCSICQRRYNLNMRPQLAYQAQQESTRYCQNTECDKRGKEIPRQLLKRVGRFYVCPDCVEGAKRKWLIE